MRVLLICYDIDPFKGGEPAVAWNIAEQLSSICETTVVTRPNNISSCRKHCEKKILNIEFQGFDLSVVFRILKGRIPGGIFIYAIIWQYFLYRKLRLSALKYDIIHSVNFVSDTIPSFAYKLNTKTVWGPISHHEPIPRELNTVLGNLVSRTKFYLRSLIWTTFSIREKIKKFDLVLYSNESVPLRLGRTTNMKRWPSTGVEAKYGIEGEEINSKVVVVTFAGRMVPIKGWMVLCDAIEKLSREKNVKRVHFDLIGDGPMFKQIKKRLEKRVCNHKISWLLHGSLKHRKFLKLMQSSHVYACPSFEGGGIAVAEAMSIGLPVICFDNFGPGETVGPDYKGLVRKNLEGRFEFDRFYDRLLNIIEDESFRQICRQQSLKRVKDHLLWADKVEKVMSFYADLSSANKSDETG